MQTQLYKESLFYSMFYSMNALLIPDSHYEKKNAQNERIIAHFEYFFTCHCSKIVWLTENLKEIKITDDEKIFSHIKQKFSHFEKWLGNMLTKKTFFYLAKIAIIFPWCIALKVNQKLITKISNYQTHRKSSFKRNYFQWI